MICFKLARLKNGCMLYELPFALSKFACKNQIFLPEVDFFFSSIDNIENWIYYGAGSTQQIRFLLHTKKSGFTGSRFLFPSIDNIEITFLLELLLRSKYAFCYKECRSHLNLWLHFLFSLILIELKLDLLYFTLSIYQE